MPLVWLITLLIVLSIWHLNPLLISASFVKGALIAIEIMLIIFSAIWLIAILQEKQKIKTLHTLLVSISPDARIQAIIIAWLFGSLIEGIAGFGTPAALAAPLLVSLGFNPILAVITSLVANSTAVSFGAAGTPILFGLGKLGFENDLLKQVYQTTAIFHFIGSIIIPILIAYFVVSFKEKNEKIKRILEIVPFAILAWLSFSVPYIFIALFIGPELPSIIGGLVGLIITSTAAHYRILVPKKILSFDKKIKEQKPKFKSVITAVFPYFTIIFLLLISRTIPQIKEILSNITLEWKNILSTEINYQFLPLYTPSFYIIIASIICILLFNVKSSEIKITLAKTINKIKKPLLTLVFALALVQLILVSSNNTLNMPGIPIVIAESLANIFKNSYIFIAPLIGIFGAFLAGSNTLSNFLFGTVQSQTADSLNLPKTIILALQVVGGAIGNMIAVHNILAANATVGLVNKEGVIIRRIILVALIYALIVSLSAFFIIHFS